MLNCIYSSSKLTKNFLLQLQSGHPLDEMSIGCILRDLLHAIEYLHNEGKIHRDIKGFLSPTIYN
jgi:serine/threonine protein kinase